MDPDDPVAPLLVALAKVGKLIAKVNAETDAQNELLREADRIIAYAITPYTLKGTHAAH